jgi:hypothetical protein
VLGGEPLTVTEEGQKLALVILHHAGAMKFLQLAKRIGSDQRPEEEVDELPEARPGQHAIFTLQGIVPLGGDTTHG